MSPTRVLIVDDHPLFRRGLRGVIEGERDLELCGEADDVGPALELVRRDKPDLVLIDISLPSGSGLDLAKQIRAVAPGARLLFVSMHDDAIFAERGLRAGALGYINKGRPAGDLLAAIRRAATGRVVLSPRMRERMGRGVADPGDGRAGVEQLSDRELEVFELIGRGLATREIAERLCVSVKTVEAHRANIKLKLDIETAPDLVRRAALWTSSGC